MIKLIVTACILAGAPRGDAACFELAATDQFERMQQCHDMRERMARESAMIRLRGDAVLNARCVVELEG